MMSCNFPPFVGPNIITVGPTNWSLICQFICTVKKTSIHFCQNVL